jgi:hypothetical protein
MNQIVFEVANVLGSTSPFHLSKPIFLTVLIAALEG